MTTLESPPAAAPPGRLREAGDRNRPPKLTVPRMFFRTVETHRDRTALMYKAGGQWHPIPYGELARRVRELALGLVELGVQPGERVALLSENRPQWAITDLAVLGIGAVNVPLYATLPPPQVEYILRDSGAVLAVVSHEKQLAKVLAIRDRLPDLRLTLVFDPPGTLPDGVLPLDEIARRGAAVPSGEEAFRRRGEAVKPEDVASIIYTSGTTGDPKGAILTHDNFMSNAQSAAPLIEIREDDLFLSFLPLSHVFERMAGHYFPLLVGATVAYAESIFTVQSNMLEVRPTIVASVPRLYETIHARVADRIRKLPPSRRALAEWAIRIGGAYHSRRIRGERPDWLARSLYPVADALVLRRIREQITGGRLRYFISGGAALPLRTAEFLTALGLHILEGYGLTETSPVICVNRPERTKLGTVGPPIPGVEVRIADDGEILTRGPHVMLGYFNKPEETAKAIDCDGWFHTGDIGELDEEGYLRITDRKKDIIVLANGKNVAPQPIEARLKASPWIANAVLFGDGQPQIVALIVPDLDALRAWARERGLPAESPEDLIERPEVKRLIREEIDKQTQDLADFEKVRRFALLPRDFTLEAGELTPTQKVRRQVVAQRYAEQIRSLYGGRGD